jgi:hypothetical protein
MNMNDMPHNYLANPPASMLEGIQANDVPSN